MAAIRPEDLSRSTRALFVGVSQYQDLELTDLTSAAREANKLATILADVNGCAIPENNISVVAEESATKHGIISALEALAHSATKNDTLFIYFAGHAVNLDDTFYLCPTDCRVSALRESAISSRDLQTLLATTSARGVLLVLDCCGSAGLAAKAPSFFRSLSGSDFRILLTASREEHEAYEPADGSGTLFSKQLLRILSGEDPAGYEPGKIYFSGLYEALYFGLAGDDQAIAAQEPVFIGTYARDPLVFVHRKLLLSDITVGTTRISRAHLRRLVRNLATTTAAGILLALGTWLAWLDAHEYAELTPPLVSINRGYPGLNAFGYPKLLEERSYSADEFDDQSLIRQYGFAVAPMGESAQAVIDASLKPAYAALRQVADGNREDARDTVWRILQDKAETERGAWDVLVSSMVLVEIVRPSDEARLQTLIDETPQLEVRTNAVNALLELGADSAFDVLETHPDEAFEHYSILNQLEAPCTRRKARYLGDRVQSSVLHNDGLFLLDSALRIGCRLSHEHLERLVLAFTFDQIEATSGLLDLISAEGFLDYLRRRSSSMSPTDRLRVATALMSAAEEPVCAIDPDFANSQSELAWQLRAIEYSSACQDVSYTLDATPTRFVIHERNDRINPIEIAVSTINYSEVGVLLRLLERLAEREVRQDLMLGILNQPVDSVVKARVIHALRELGADFTAYEAREDHENSVELRSALVHWRAASDIAGARDYLLGRIDDGDFFEFPELLYTVGANCPELETMTVGLSTSSQLEQREVIALTMLADHEVLETLLTHRLVSVRNVARNYALANRDIDKLLASDNDDARRILAPLIAHRDRILKELGPLSIRNRNLRTMLIISARRGATSTPEQFLSSGLFLQLRGLVGPPLPASPC